jgi:rSAM/selenodomain-associated transferase 1
MNNNQDSENIIGIMAKYPEEGMVKTRLVPPLTYGQAASLYEAILLDTIETVNKLDPYFKKVIFYYPENKRTYFNNIISSDWLSVAQSGKDLGQRLENAFLGFKDHISPVIIIGSDSPAIPGQYLTDSIALLQDNNIVLGPTEDGGFYLIAIKDISRSFIEDLFKNIRWSTSNTLSDIIRNLNMIKKRFALTGKWYDIDTAQDIEKFLSRLNKNNFDECRKTSLFISKYL